MRVRVYRNLHKNVWSVVNVRTGRVVMHADQITLSDVKFRVQPAGNALVRKCGRKNVHAYAVGTVETLDWSGVGVHRVRYNPYIMNTFEYVDGTPAFEAPMVEFTGTGNAFVSCPPMCEGKE